MSEGPQEYRVLARKYRPQNFDQLIGQDVLVRTLRNAIESGRIAHAFMLTGVRGVGKTTTARIIAKALNYRGADGQAGPTTGDTSDCDLCAAIAQDRHPDVMEMDAASRTGIDDIREILDGVRYAPSDARYKVYIIDEVHMLSKAAFNALLKTLEEPPEHVKFIFATTEIRKVPITVLSRCQRFDLRRVDEATLSAHFASICEQEGVKAEDEALRLIARAADGSVRDGLSLLDQAMASGAEVITGEQVQHMLGLADQALGLDVLEAALGGDVQTALDMMDRAYVAGSDPLVMLQDMLGFVHHITRARSVKSDDAAGFTPDLAARLSDMAGALPMPSLGKAWQILLKGVGEVQSAPHPGQAAEMVVIRLAYAADLPDPKDLIKKLSDGAGTSSAPAAAPVSVVQSGAGAPSPAPSSSDIPSAAMVQAPLASVAPQSTPVEMPKGKNFEDILAMLEQNGEMVLASELRHHVEVIKCDDHLLELGLRDNASARVKTLQKTLSGLTGQRWMVSFTAPQGRETVAETQAKQKRAAYDAALQEPLVQQIIQAFPGAELVDIIDPSQTKGD